MLNLLIQQINNSSLKNEEKVNSKKSRNHLRDGHPHFSFQDYWNASFKAKKLSLCIFITHCNVHFCPTFNWSNWQCTTDRIAKGNVLMAVTENHPIFSSYWSLPWHQLWKQYFYKLKIINSIDFGLLLILKWFFISSSWYNVYEQLDAHAMVFDLFEKYTYFFEIVMEIKYLYISSL